MSDQSKPTILTRDQIMQAADLPTEVVEVQEWGGAVVIQGVDLATGMSLLKQMEDKDGKIDTEKSALLAIVYGVREPKFTADDMEWLRGKSLGAVTKVTRAWMKLCGFDAAALPEARKNS